jgi:aspartate/methionine/tyrosine aminotransferase
MVRWRPFKLERFFARYEFNVDYVLCASDCETLPVRELLALDPGAEDRLLDLRLGYTESAGAPSLRSQIAAIYDTITPDQILVHSGAEEAIFLFMHAVLEPGDHLVVHAPCYQSLAEVARGLGCEVSPWTARASEGWALDPDELRRLLRPTTRAVVLNVPHNPTGYLMDPDRYREVVAITEGHPCLLLSDEVYREAEYHDADRLRAACDVSETAVSLGVMSKTYGLPGLRLGWVATHNPSLTARMAQLKDYTTICNAAPSEMLAEVALRHRGALVARSVALLRRNLDLLADFIARHPDVFTWQPPGAGPIAFLRLVGRPAAAGAEAFCEQLAREAGVLLLPGTVYDVEGYVRIGFGRQDFPEALARLEAYLAGW